jgi:hypothetical protein
MDALRADLTAHMAGLPARPRPVLAPLEPDAFLAWVWKYYGEATRRTPLTSWDLWYELASDAPFLTQETIRRDLFRLSARARRNQRLGLRWNEAL